MIIPVPIVLRLMVAFKLIHPIIIALLHDVDCVMLNAQDITGSGF